MRTKTLIPSAILLISSLMHGCAWIDEIGHDKSFGSIQIVPISENIDDKALQCAIDKFPLEFWEFNADSQTDNEMRFRFYESLFNPIEGNYMAVNFVHIDADTQEPCPNPEDYEGKTVDVTANGCVRAVLQINSCDDPSTLRLEGKLTLTSLSLKRRGWVEGSFSGQISYVQIEQSSTDKFELQRALGDVSCKFAFVIHAGAIWNK